MRLGKHGQVRVFVDWRDLWIGYYRAREHHYICLIPCVVVQWPRAVRV